MPIVVVRLCAFHFRILSYVAISCTTFPFMSQYVFVVRHRQTSQAAKNTDMGRKRWFQDACDVDTCDEAASLANSARPLDVPVVVD